MTVRLVVHSDYLLGITGVPAVSVVGRTAFVTGAQPYETYRRWAEKLLATGA